MCHSGLRLMANFDRVLIGDGVGRGCEMQNRGVSSNYGGHGLIFVLDRVLIGMNWL